MLDEQPGVMTCTGDNWPRELGRDLQRWEVAGGALTPDATANRRAKLVP